MRYLLALRPALVLLAALVLLLPAVPALAQPTLPDDLRCPVDGAVVHVRRVVASNLLGGIDSDFCPYSSGVQAREHEIATCPSCLYSSRVARFGAPLDGHARDAVRQALAPFLATVEDTERIPPWQRYELAATTAAILGKDPGAIGHLYLEGAWTVRDRIVGFLPRVSGPQEIAQTLDELEPKAETLTDRDRWAGAHLDMHRAAWRGGLTSRADGYLSRILAAKGVSDSVLDRVARIRDWIALEHRYLERALAQLRISLARRGGDDADRARTDYLIGDLLRRLGRGEEGMPLVRRQAENPAAPEDVRAAARQVVEASGG